MLYIPFENNSSQIFMKRRLSVGIFFAGADINITVGICAILGGPTNRPIPTSYARNFIAENHNVLWAIFRKFFTSGVVVFDGMEMRRGDLLVSMP